MAPKIAIITYSMYGHVDKLADSIEAGAKAAGAQVTRLQVPETLPDEVLAKMYAPPKKEHIKVLTNPADLTEFDGFLFGFPTRYGRAPAQISAFFDHTGQLWMKGALTGKFAGIFTSTASQHGGQEATFLTTIPYFAHHGLIYVPIGYVCPELQDNTEVLGGTPYGASTIAGGDGSRQPNDKELAVAAYQGKHFAETVGTFLKGKASPAPAVGRADVPATTTAAAPATNALTPAKDPPTANGYDAGAAAGAPSAARPPREQVASPGARQPRRGQPGLVQKLAMSCGGNKSNYES